MRHFLKKGHFPTLIITLISFNCSFMIWFLFVANYENVFAGINISFFEKWFIICISLFGGSLLRIPMGYFVDRYGGKRMAIINMILMMVPLLIGMSVEKNVFNLYLISILLSFAGANFSIVIPFIGSHYPKEHLGLVTGIVGAGNLGIAISILTWPHLSQTKGWNYPFEYSLIILLVTLLLFTLIAKEKRKENNGNSMLKLLQLMQDKLLWKFSIFYSLSFGAFISLSVFLSYFFIEHYHINILQVIEFVAIIAIGGSLFRPVGGYLGDRYDGYALLIHLFRGAAVILIIVGVLPNVYVELSMIFITLLFLGISNGTLFQLIAVHYQDRMGIVSGLVGSIGALGGVFWTYVFHLLNQLLNSYSYGFWILGFAIFTAMLMIMKIQVNRDLID